VGVLKLRTPTAASSFFSIPAHFGYLLHIGGILIFFSDFSQAMLRNLSWHGSML
jgi:hypothetical protein